MGVDNFGSMTSPSTCQYIDCRSYTTTVNYLPKTKGAVQVYLAGFYVGSTGGPSNANSYEGITLETSSPTTNYFSLNITVYGSIEIIFASLFYVAFEPAIVNVVSYRAMMYSRSLVGCYYDPNGCGSLSNSSFKTPSTTVMVPFPYYTQMFFFGTDRIIALWPGNSGTNIAFDTPSVGTYSTGITVNFQFTGNTNQYFHMGFSYFSIQTFYCPNTPPCPYYTYNANTCTDACNNGIMQYANSTRYCLPCGVYCYMCVGTANFCTACFNNQSRVPLTNGTCACDTANGVYDDGTSLVCPACYYSCLTCSGGTISSCLSCSTSSNRVLVNNTCQCVTGYFDNGAMTCVACYYTCATATCTNSSTTTCLTCNSSQFRVILANYTCACVDGYYDSGTNSELCLPCLYSCLTCWGTNTYCTNCSTTDQRTFNPTTNTCYCAPGYYDAGVSACQSCYATCQTCTGGLGTNCLTCFSGSNRFLNVSTCTCAAGFYDSSNLCLPCDPTCVTCTAGTAFSCLSCSSSNFRVLNSTLGDCACMPGYVDVGLPLCQPCAVSCLTCTVNSTDCTSCLASAGRYLSGGYCLCGAGYVDVYFNGTCSVCYYSCATCGTIASTGCLTCTANRTLSAGSCLCPAGTYDNGVNATCQLCAVTCLNCSSALATSCSACNAVYMRYLAPSPTGSCLCSNGYYDNTSLLCAACSLKCLTCSGSATHCTACDLPTNHRALSATFTCDCVAGYYDTGAAVCLACAISCLTCTGTSTFCTSCSPNYYLSASNLCLCVNGTFLNGSGLCQTCSYTCQTCYALATNCTSCYAGVNRYQSSNTCPCLSGYYDYGVATCQLCLYSCSACASASVCTGCPTGSLRTLQLNGSCTCAAGYYDDGSHTLCATCYYACATCSYYSQCLTCSPTALRTLDPGSLSCPCNTGYYDSGVALCTPCYYSCSACTTNSSSSCTSCQPLRTLTSGSCPCQAGTYQSAGVCSPCGLVCLTCSVAASNCTSCYTGSYLSNYQCLCTPGYYFNGLTCVVCDNACATCSSTASYCLSCNSAYGTLLTGSTCLCPNGTYQSVSLVCVSCSAFCLTCSGNTTCLTCSTTAFRTLTSSACVCLPGYYDSGSVTCQLCVSPCLTCNGGSVLNCTSCLAGYTLIGSFCRAPLTCPSYSYAGYCVSACPNTTYPVGSVCTACTSNCLTCLSGSVCSSCVASYYLLPNASCLASCPVGTYASGGVCTLCPTGCVTCVLRTNYSAPVCVSCLAGYYFTSTQTCTNYCPSDQTHVVIQNRCVPCLSPCATCLNLTATSCLSCTNNYILFNGSCLSTCPSAYYLSNSVCLPCPATCLSCADGRCLTCATGYYLSPASICLLNGYFLSSSGQLTPCHPNCKTCSNSSFSSCIACGQYRGDASALAISGYCDCWKGSIDLGNGTCDPSSYTALQSATETLVSASSAVTYITALAGVASLNLMSAFFAVSYQQLYGNFYYVNASAVAQTNNVLEHYSLTSPNTYFNSIKHSSQTSSTSAFGSRRLWTNLQMTESLFMRGAKWQYLVEWALGTVVLIAVVCVLIFCVNCLMSRLKGKVSKQKVSKKQSQTKKGVVLVVFQKILSILCQSSVILIHLLTINQMSIYALASFKIILCQPVELDVGKLALSVLVVVYYLGYILRLVVACVRYGGSREEVKKFMLLWACFQSGRKKRGLCRLYVPLMLLRSVCISTCLVVLSSSPFGQVVSAFGVFLLWCVYSFCFCPYGFYLRVFVRVFELLFCIQLTVLCISTLKPEYSRMPPAVGLLVLNYLQMAGFAGMGVVVLFNSFFGVRCIKEENIVAPLDPKGEEIEEEGKRNGGETLDNIDEEIDNNKIANQFYEAKNEGTDHFEEGYRRREEHQIDASNAKLVSVQSSEFAPYAINTQFTLGEGLQEVRKKRSRPRKDKVYL